MTDRICLACLAVMLAAGLAFYPLSVIGLELAAGLAFILAMLIAWIVAAASALQKLWRG